MKVAKYYEVVAGLFAIASVCAVGAGLLFGMFGETRNAMFALVIGVLSFVISALQRAIAESHMRASIRAHIRF